MIIFHLIVAIGCIKFLFAVIVVVVVVSDVADDDVVMMMMMMMTVTAMTTVKMLTISHMSLGELNVSVFY